MAVPEVALTRIRRYCDDKTSESMRDQMRLEVTTRGNSVTIHDCRPLWEGQPGEWARLSVAQFRYDPTTKRWTLYWADRNDRWHAYDDLNATVDLDRVLAELDDDRTGIFWG